MLTAPARLTKHSGITIGNFDGVHLGHQKLIGQTLEACHKQDLECVVVTFWPHPRAFFAKKAIPPLIDLQTRRKILGHMGVDYLLELTFDQRIAELSPEQFLEKYLYPLNLSQLFIGYDFCLGKSRSGDKETLVTIGQEHDFSVQQVSALLLDDEPISSTRLRKAILQGDMLLARQMLGRPHGFTGHVIHGQGRGTSLGFPTANTKVPYVQLPPDGVYATQVTWNERLYASVTNIGFNPTFGGNTRSVESFLLDCDVNLYGEDIQLDFLARLRGERRFPDIQALTAQIAKDVEQARLINAQYREEAGVQTSLELQSVKENGV